MPLSPPQPQGVQQFAQPLLVHLLPVQQDGEGHILHHVQHRDEVVKLVDEPHLTAAEDGQLLLVLGVHVAAVHKYLTAGGFVHASQQVQQGGLARPGGADNGHKFPSVHGKRHVIQGFDLIFPGAVGFAQMLHTKQFHVHSSFGIVAL